MKAGFLTKPNTIEFLEVEMPEPKPNEVRIKLSKVGICGSDVHLFLGYRNLSQPTIIGHEGIGYIDKIGLEVFDRKIGERVAVEPNIPCKNCRHCLTGNGTICVNKRVIGLNELGCFAEYVVIPSEFAHSIPKEMDDADAVCIEPMAVAVHALFKSKAKPGDSIAIIGLGAIGLLITHLALKLGIKVFVTEIKENKLSMAKGLGANVVSALLHVDKISKIWEENEVVSVFECAGISNTATLAAAAAPRGSEIILVGLATEIANFQPLKLAREGIHIVPSIIYDHPFDFKRTIHLINARIISPSFIISKNMHLDHLQDALSFAAEGGETKVVIEI